MIRNVVFDMGGVLMDFHPLTACRAAAPDEAGARRLDDALFKHPLWGRLDDDTLTPEELGRMAEAALTDPALRPLVGKVLDAMPFNMLSPLPGMAGVVSRTLDAGYRVYLLSNAGRKISGHREIIPHIGRFDGVVFSVEERVKKPEPEIYRRLTSRYGLRPEECFFIDDDPGNVQAARDLGWQGYRFDGDVPALGRALEALKRDDAP